MKRVQVLVAIVVPVLLLAGAVYADRELGARTYEPGQDGPARSGAWFCPHGGGPEGWEVMLQVANPGDRPASVRVRSLASERPAEPETLEVEPGALVRVPVPANGRGRSSMVEWFGQWVAVGWLAHAGGGEGGVAAEPCAPTASTRWLLPDGTSETQGDHDFVVVMNPFAREAVFSLTLFSERKEPVRHSSLTDVVLRPLRSVAVNLNEVVLGERTVSALVDVSVGRVAAATFGVAGAGGIRAALGYAGVPPAELVYPGGEDAGRTELVVLAAGEPGEGERVTVAGDIMTAEEPVPFAGLADASMPSGSARTFPASTSGSGALRITAVGEEVAAVRRSFGAVSDQAAVTGAEPAGAWIVLPAVAGAPSHPELLLANPGVEPAVVTLGYLAPGPSAEVTVRVPPGTAVRAPEGFVGLAPDAGVWAVASSGTFVPTAASYSLGREGFATYAVSVGIVLPEGTFEAFP